MVDLSIVLSVVLSTAIGFAQAQRVDIQGTIRDRYTMEPISQARVTLVGINLEATTDSFGRFRILQMPTTTTGVKPSRFLRSAGGGVIVFRCDLPGPMTLQLRDAAGKVTLKTDFMSQNQEIGR